MPGADGAELVEPTYPPAETMHLAAIDETVPVYYDAIRIVRDVHLLGSRELPDVLKGRDELEVRGTFDYQACDARKRYPPARLGSRPPAWLRPRPSGSGRACLPDLVKVQVPLRELNRALRT